MKKSTGIAIFLGIAAMMLTSQPASASTIVTFTAGNGATGEASFTFGSNSLTLVLTNTTVDPGDVAYNLSGFDFTLSGGTGGVLTNESSPESRSVAADGSFTDAGPVNGLANVGWVPTVSGSTVKLDVLAGAGHAGPENTILGLPSTGGKYASANGSIAGNPAHNPFLANSITYSFTFASGVDINTTVTAADYQFGTTDGKFSAACGSGSGCGVVTTTPEPGTILSAFTGLGLLGIGVIRRRVPRRP